MRNIFCSAAIILAAMIQVNCGENSMTKAIREHDQAGVEALLSQGIDIDGALDGDGRTPLMMAAYKGTPEIMQLLIDHKADLNAKDRNGSDAMIFAARGGSCSNITKLAEKGKKVDPEEKAKHTALMEAAANADAHSVKCLIDLGADPDRQDGSGNTALMYAVRSKDLATVKLLIDTGADSERKNDKNETAAAIATALDLQTILRAIQNGSQENNTFDPDTIKIQLEPSSVPGTFDAKFTNTGKSNIYTAYAKLDASKTNFAYGLKCYNNNGTRQNFATTDSIPPINMLRAGDSISFSVTKPQNTRSCEIGVLYYADGKAASLLRNKAAALTPDETTYVDSKKFFLQWPLN